MWPLLIFICIFEYIFCIAKLFIHSCKFMEAQNNKVVLYIHYKQQEQAYMCVDQVELDLLNYLLVKIEYVCRVKARV